MGATNSTIGDVKHVGRTWETVGRRVKQSRKGQVRWSRLRIHGTVENVSQPAVSTDGASGVAGGMRTVRGPVRRWQGKRSDGSDMSK